MELGARADRTRLSGCTRPCIVDYLVLPATRVLDLRPAANATASAADKGIGVDPGPGGTSKRRTRRRHSGEKKPSPWRRVKLRKLLVGVRRESRDDA